MKKLNKIVITFILVINFIVGSAWGTESLDSTIPSGIKCLVESYPEHLIGATENAIIWNDGSKMVYDDGQQKGFNHSLQNVDLEDQLSMQYPVGENTNTPLNFDPGRLRNEIFFQKMYGTSQSQIENKIITVKWLPQSTSAHIEVTSVNEIDKKVEQISTELEKLSVSLKVFVDKPAGSFVWRKIKGTNRQSTHSYGIAIDINLTYGDYWKWGQTNSNKLVNKNRIPYEIVRIFEKYDFIWGGKWYHYDTLHFEYRPELFCMSRKTKKAQRQ